MTLGDESLSIHLTADVQEARRIVRNFAAAAGLSMPDVEDLVLAASEVATNVVRHATSGAKLQCSVVESGGESAVEVVVRDSGPGIPDITLAMQEGYSTGSGLGSGLAAAKRHVDAFMIESSTKGTTVRLQKRIKRP